MCIRDSGRRVQIGDVALQRGGDQRGGDRGRDDQCDDEPEATLAGGIHSTACLLNSSGTARAAARVARSFAARSWRRISTRGATKSHSSTTANTAYAATT